MKKIFAVALVAMMTMTVNAQVYVGGGVGLQSSSYDGNSETFFKLVPEIGYNLDENWAVGIAVGYGEHKTTLKSGNLKTTAKVKAFEIAPYARYTFAKCGKVNFFVDGGVGFKTASKADWTEFNVGLKPGLAVALSDKVSFVSHFGFLGYDVFNPEGDKNNVSKFGLDLDGNDLTFGLYFNF
jgi:hypothetical protein